MSVLRSTWLLPSLLLLGLSGCVAVSRVDGARAVQQRLSSATPLAAPLPRDADAAASEARVAELLSAALTPASAVQVAFLRNPRVVEITSRLGLSQADVVAASRISNPLFSGSLIQGGGERQAIGELDLSLTDLLLLSARRHLAAGEYQRAQELVASSLLDLVRDTEAAWYRYVGAEQLAAMRAATARAAATSALLAQRFFDAGNISELDLTLQRAAATRAQIEARRAAIAARCTKYELQQLMGLTGDPAWQAEHDLPVPATISATPDDLVLIAREHRPDLRAAREETDLLSEALELAKRWRWLGTVEVGVQREREPDTHVLTGPTLSLALPIFNQGQPAIARATAQLDEGRARLRTLESSVANAVRLDLERVINAAQVAAEYRQALVPEHELILQREQELQNFMFVGQFELLLSKQQEYDAYQGYLEAVRDYWLARVDLARQLGTEPPGVTAEETGRGGGESVLGPPGEPTGNEEHRQHQQGMGHQEAHASPHRGDRS